MTINNYKKTLNIVSTGFPMRGNLKIQQKKITKYWQSLNINQKIINRPNKKKFILQDGPAYANGHLHMGHLLNKILKDIILRNKQQQNYQVDNITGHDCNGLPIQLKACNKDDIKDIITARKKCHAYADKWIEEQRKTMKEIGILMDTKYYATHRMVNEIYETYNKLLLDNQVFYHQVPMLWCQKTKGVIADVDVEYKNIDSNAVTVKLKILSGEFVGKYVTIWTTTPWSLFDNVAVAFNKDFSYVLIDDNFFCSDLCGQEIMDQSKIFKGEIFKGVTCAHPITGKAVPLLHGDLVTKDVGTGFVHLAPAHGPVDYELCQDNNIPLIDSISEDGYIIHSAIEKTHMSNFEAIKNLLGDKLIAHDIINHSYPHSARSKAPLFYRADGQLFLKIKDISPEFIKKAAENIKMYPKFVKNRFTNYMISRNWWCISRNRFWGTPIVSYIHKKTQKILINKEVQNKIQEKLKEDTHFFFDEGNAMRFLRGILPNANDYFYYQAILDVWFDAGCVSTFPFLRDKLKPDIPHIYVEGLDQTRGWFQVSSWIGLFLNKKIPFNELVMHGFVVDDNRDKLSKSKGNAKSANEMINEYGTEILRLWVFNSNYEASKVPLTKTILANASGMYRFFRNNIRYVISVVETFKNTKAPLLHKHAIIWDYFCHKIEEYYKLMNEYHFSEAIKLFYDLLTFLSGGPFNAMKSVLYCYAPNTAEHKSIVALFHLLLKGILKILTVILPLTAEEIFLYTKEASITMDQFTGKSSVHLNTYDIPKPTGIYKEVEHIIEILSPINKQVHQLLSDKSINRVSQCVLQVPNQKIKDNISSFINIRSVSVGPITKVLASKERLCHRCFHFINQPWELKSDCCLYCKEALEYRAKSKN